MIREKASLGFFVCSKGLFRFREALAKSVCSSPSSHTSTPSRFKISTFCSLNTIPPPVTIIVCCVPFTLRSASVSASRNFLSPCSEKISGIDIPNSEATISSVSSRAKPVRPLRQRPTEDLPAPIIPIRTIDRLTCFTFQYLTNTWFQPGAVHSGMEKPARLSKFCEDCPRVGVSRNGAGRRRAT